MLHMGVSVRRRREGRREWSPRATHVLVWPGYTHAAGAMLTVTENLVLPHAKELTQQSVREYFPQEAYKHNSYAGIIVNEDRSTLFGLKCQLGNSAYFNEVLPTGIIAFEQSKDPVRNSLLSSQMGSPPDRWIPMHLVYNKRDFHLLCRVVGKDDLGNTSRTRWLLAVKVLQDDATSQTTVVTSLASQSRTTCDVNPEQLPVPVGHTLSAKNLASEPELGPCRAACSSEQRGQIVSCKKTRYAGHMFDSRLEARHAAFFDLLGEPYVPHADTITLQGGTQGSTKYTPDFYMPRLCMYIEVKPCYPTEEALQKACWLAVQRNVYVAVVYGGSLESPFAHAQVEYTHPHHNGVAAVTIDSAGSITGHRASWVVGDDGQVCLRERRHYSDLGWQDPRILSCLHGAKTLMLDEVADTSRLPCLDEVSDNPCAKRQCT